VNRANIKVDCGPKKRIGTPFFAFDSVRDLIRDKSEPNYAKFLMAVSAIRPPFTAFEQQAIANNAITDNHSL
jgi:hypothetical protein